MKIQIKKIISMLIIVVILLSINICSFAYDPSYCEITYGDHYFYSYYNPEPDCENEGVRITKCGPCGYVKSTQYIYPYGHNWKPATCEIPSTCSRCDKTTGSAKGHQLVINTLGYWECIRTGCNYTRPF